MKTYPSVGSQIELTNLLSHEALHARVVGVRRDSEGHLLGVAVELLVPSETFWGVNFQLKKACADLVKLEYDMRSGSIDQRVLKEFREAVDNVRKTADRKSTRLNSSHPSISYAVFCLKKKKNNENQL